MLWSALCLSVSVKKILHLPFVACFHHWVAYTYLASSELSWSSLAGSVIFHFMKMVFIPVNWCGSCIPQHNFCSENCRVKCLFSQLRAISMEWPSHVPDVNYKCMISMCWKIEEIFINTSAVFKFRVALQISLFGMSYNQFNLHSIMTCSFDARNTPF